MQMKLLLLVIFFLIGFFGKSFAQIAGVPRQNISGEKFDEQINVLLKKSNKQKKFEWIFLGGGLALNVISTSIADAGTEENSGVEVLSGLSGIATIGSIPLFFAASRNKNKAQFLYFKKNFTLATSDSVRKIYLEDATEYFSGKARANTTTAIIISVVGGALVIAGIAFSANNGQDDTVGFFDLDFAGLAFIASGVSVGALSIPFYVRGGRLKRTAKMILRTGRFPTMEFGNISPTIRMGRQLSIGIAVQL